MTKLEKVRSKRYNISQVRMIISSERNLIKRAVLVAAAHAEQFSVCKGWDNWSKLLALLPNTKYSARVLRIAFTNELQRL